MEIEEYFEVVDLDVVDLGEGCNGSCD